MKKTLLALSVLSALSVAAQAAEVKVYGKVDTGLAFVSIDNGQDNGTYNNLSMMSGQTAGSRWGITGTEDLGNGLKVGIRLESGMNVDTGSLGQGGKLFGRQADLRVMGDFGTVKFGRMGALTSGYPDTGLFGGNISPFAVGLGEVGGHRYIYSSEDALPLDNTITYATPKFLGDWQVMLQYSMGMNEQLEGSRENESTIDRYAAAALHYNSGNTEFSLAVDWTNFASYGTAASTAYGSEPDDGWRVTTALRHGLDFMTLYLGGQYFKDSRRFTQETNHFYKQSNEKWLTNTAIAKDGYGLQAGFDYPALGGTWKGQVGWMDAEQSDDSSYGLKRWFVSAGYWYDFSKRTTLYSGISYIHDSLDGENYKNYDDASCISASLGLVHNF